jgi:hypothetical protein
MLQEGGTADAAASLEAAIFNIGVNVNFPRLENTELVLRKDATFEERLLRDTEQSATRGTFGARTFFRRRPDLFRKGSPPRRRRGDPSYLNR